MYMFRKLMCARFFLLLQLGLYGVHGTRREDVASTNTTIRVEKVNGSAAADSCVSRVQQCSDLDRRCTRQMCGLVSYLLKLPADERERMMRATEYTYTMTDPAPLWRPSVTYDSRIAFISVNGVSAARELLKLGLRPALLNIATNEFDCGGAFDQSCHSEETTLFGATSTFLSLWPHRSSDDGANAQNRHEWIGQFDDELDRSKAFYPLSECGGIYSPHVKVVHEFLKDSYGDYSPAFGLITVAPQDMSQSDADTPFNSSLLRQKLRTILYMAATNGHDSVVLGAFGCSYHENPPEVVASTFDDLLKTEFANTFQAVLLTADIGPNYRAIAKAFERFQVTAMRSFVAEFKASPPTASKANLQENQPNSQEETKSGVGHAFSSRMVASMSCIVLLILLL
eukprot:TRINITY_DN21303_c0_g1_i1.p1 TRINITY_DN21303_c0_g1~~TRINITY_DN21303_c0_g1_i1.p1  ORF type:complete len:398 (-),score=44.20 TRINITY_DN21303_c0_g1_i1:279-1472(-)